MPPLRRWRLSLLLGAGTVALLYYMSSAQGVRSPLLTDDTQAIVNDAADAENDNVRSSPRLLSDERYPVKAFIPLPTAPTKPLPKIQAQFPEEDEAKRSAREKRREAVLESFKHAWSGYKRYAWMQDELAPVTGVGKKTFGGWAASLVDTLDTLWIMGLTSEFENAIKAVSKIDFTKTEATSINVFETTIRYLGGFLGAYDISERKYPVLLKKAKEVADVLYGAFDTPDRLPVMRWSMNIAKFQDEQETPHSALVAEIGSLTLEFTRLAQLTKDPKYFDAVQRITDFFEEGQNKTMLPGFWPVSINPARRDFKQGNSFTLGGMADSLYEYLPKQHALLGGVTKQYQNMYEKSIEVAKKHLFYRPMLKDDDVLFSGDATVMSHDKISYSARAQHLTCFVGGMVGVGAKLFEREKDLKIARKLTDGCIWAYRAMPSGIMPEIFYPYSCNRTDDCPWDEKEWRSAILDQGVRVSDEQMSEEEQIDEAINRQGLVPGVASMSDKRYLLRPEAIESVFVLYRITADQKLQDQAWDMFSAIEKVSRTRIAHSAISDVTTKDPEQTDSMESFWLAETLKYFYLIFSEPDLVSLDKYVLNTEAHPFERP